MLVHRFPIAFTAAVLAALLVIGGTTPTLAQQATPAAGAGDAPDPVECVARPRAADELIALWYVEGPEGTPVLASPVAAAALTSVPVPLGDPADAETVAGVTQTVREVFACFNAGDFARALSLFSDDMVRRFGPSPEETIEDVRGFVEAAPEPAPAEARVRLIAVTDVAVLADGRVAAFVVSDDPTVPPDAPETALVVFIEQEGRWLVDDVVEFVPVGDEGDAT